MVKGKNHSASERQMIVNAYQFFKNQREEGQGEAGRIREKVFECLETPVSTVSNQWRDQWGYFYDGLVTVHNVTYRATYLQHKVQNRDRNNNPIHPEVYLDESYVNTNHVRGTTWFVEESFENWVANRKGSEGDYHRNFDAAQFELWFTYLSQQLSI
ncbi:hypothetical protein PHMEG_00029402 [Phytophthora megakarya]|uniref:Uncharacterized protein n=1 Tax=Phytophthora megakarya TaxID=4795 RepID=A0A225V2S9_9STRA|nr:hypothetical protein PHMEG_00029402 [Phytophthora megakarya]